MFMNIYLNEYGFFPSYLLQNILSYLRINETIKEKKILASSSTLIFKIKIKIRIRLMINEIKNKPC